MNYSFFLSFGLHHSASSAGLRVKHILRAPSGKFFLLFFQLIFYRKERKENSLFVATGFVYRNGTQRKENAICFRS